MQATDDSLPNLLKSFHDWSFPKGDLFQWIDVLNKFDEILEKICEKYKLRDQVQELEFDSTDRSLLISIIQFSVFLLDHCANRGLYASGKVRLIPITKLFTDKGRVLTIYCTQQILKY